MTRRTGPSGSFVAEKWLEHALLVLERNAWPFVLDGQLQLFGIVHARTNADRCARRRVLHSVLQQVYEDPFDLARVPRQAGQAGATSRRIGRAPSNGAVCRTARFTIAAESVDVRCGSFRPRPFCAGERTRPSTIWARRSTSCSMSAEFLASGVIPRRSSRDGCSTNPLI